MKRLIPIAILCWGCAVGPDFEKPAPPALSGYTVAPLPDQFVAGRDIPGEWWTLFRCKPLSDLVERAQKANPDLKAAQAALIVARENVLAQRGAYAPSVDVGFSASENKTSEPVAPTPASGALYFSLYTPQVSVSYVPDVFGLNRRTVESLAAQAEEQRFALIATHVTLSANVVAAVIREALLRAEIEATRELIAIDASTLQIVRVQYARGYVGRLDVAAQESQLAQGQAILPPLLKQLAQQRDLLAALAGGYPGEEPSQAIELSSLRLPAELPVTVPSRLVEQRPDVRQAEENLHSASAEIGVAVANRLPNFALTADVGTMALTAGSIFAGGAGFWTLAAGVTQPLFRGGALLHRERAARAAFDRAAEEYRSTVLTAVQNVADTLHALQEDGDALKAAAAARDAAGVTLALARTQLEAGYASNLAVLGAEQAYQQATLGLVDAQAEQYADTAALFQALGGGWWNRADLK